MAATIDVAAEVARLNGLTIFELRQEWRRLERAPPPMRLSRDLLARGIAYKLQERALGGLSAALLRKLSRGTPPSSVGEGRRPGPVVLRPGTRLVREWGGATHSVLVAPGGFEWQGRRYKSLSLVAREITGARWSGPRFFGLTRRSAAKAAERDGEGGHAPP